MEETIRPGELYRHFKNKLYQIVAVAFHPETGERMVVYQALYGDYRVYVWPYELFTSQVDCGKYPHVKQKRQFERVDPGQLWTDCGAERGPGECAAGTPADALVQEVDADQEKPHADAGEKAENIPGDAASALMDFLDSDSYEAQIASLKRMRSTATQKELDSIYLVLDMKPLEGSIGEQLRGIAGFLKMQHHFDGGHLR